MLIRAGYRRLFCLLVTLSFVTLAILPDQAEAAGSLAIVSMSEKGEKDDTMDSWSIYIGKHKFKKPGKKNKDKPKRGYMAVLFTGITDGDHYVRLEAERAGHEYQDVQISIAADSVYLLRIDQRGFGSNVHVDDQRALDRGTWEREYENHPRFSGNVLRWDISEKFLSAAGADPVIPPSSADNPPESQPPSSKKITDDPVRFEWSAGKFKTKDKRVTGPGNAPAVEELARGLLSHPGTEVFVIHWTNVYPSGSSFNQKIVYNRTKGTLRDVVSSGYYLYKGVNDEHIHGLAAKSRNIGGLSDHVGDASFYNSSGKKLY